jgi:hypothetical protein
MEFCGITQEIVAFIGSFATAVISFVNFTPEVKEFLSKLLYHYFYQLPIELLFCICKSPTVPNILSRLLPLHCGVNKQCFHFISFIGKSGITSDGSVNLELQLLQSQKLLVLSKMFHLLRCKSIIGSVIFVSRNHHIASNC